MAAKAAAISVLFLEAHGGGLSELTTKISRLGCRGKYKNNIERDLCRVLEIPVQALWVEIPVRSEHNRKDVALKKFPVICPHLLYDYLHAPQRSISQISVWILFMEALKHHLVPFFGVASFGVP